jgi:hypothetical protein
MWATESAERREVAAAAEKQAHEDDGIDDDATNSTTAAAGLPCKRLEEARSVPHVNTAAVSVLQRCDEYSSAGNGVSTCRTPRGPSHPAAASDLRGLSQPLLGPDDHDTTDGVGGRPGGAGAAGEGSLLVRLLSPGASLPAHYLHSIVENSALVDGVGDVFVAPVQPRRRLRAGGQSGGGGGQRSEGGVTQTDAASSWLRRRYVLNSLAWCVGCIVFSSFRTSHTGIVL